MPGDLGHELFLELLRFIDLLLRRQVQPLGFLGWELQLQKQIRQALSGELAQPQASSARLNFRDTVWEIQTGSLPGRHQAPGCLRLRELLRRNCRISHTRIVRPGWLQ